MPGMYGARRQDTGCSIFGNCRLSWDFLSVLTEAPKQWVPTCGSPASLAKELTKPV